MGNGHHSAAVGANLGIGTIPAHAPSSCHLILSTPFWHPRTAVIMIPPLTGWFSTFSGPSESPIPSHPRCQNSDARQEEEEELWELIEGGGGSGSGAASAASALAASRWRWNCSPACATSSSRRTSASTIGCSGEMLHIYT